jgi:hypothetical protein
MGSLTQISGDHIGLSTPLEEVKKEFIIGGDFNMSNFEISP